MQPEPVGTSSQRALLSVLELPIAVGLAFGIFVLFSLAGCHWAHCVDVSGLPWDLGGALLGIVVAVAFWVKMMRLRDRFRERLVADAIAILIGVAGYVLPQLGR